VNVAYLHIAARAPDTRPAAAEQLGSEYWMPMVALAEAAIKRGRHDIARVFAAADQPGQQRDYLHQRCIELAGAPPAPERQPSPQR
jgi:hypothetical protein